MTYIGCYIYNLSVIAGCAYLVAERGWSGWWFVLVYFLLFKVDDK